MAWTDEMIAELKVLWDKGMTTGEIGKKLNVTKNSVVGKVHRLGLDGRPSPIKRKNEEVEKPVAEPVKKIEHQKQPATPKIEHKLEAVKIEPIKATPKKELTPQKEGNVSLVELGNHSCRWPIGDPKDEGFHFCGKKTKAGQTYCEEHSAVAYVKMLKK